MCKTPSLENSRVVQICVISDDGYAMPTAVMLASARLNKNADSIYEIHCLCNGMSNFGKKKLSELHRDDFLIHILDCQSEKYANVKLPPGITASTMIKCDIAELLPHVDKILLLDGDILVKKDLLEIWQTDITDNIVAAVDDMVAMVDLGCHQLLDVQRYFNAGVMLLNLDMMRKENLGQKIIATKEAAPDSWRYGEQDPFNKVCDGSLVSLPLKWNMTPMTFRHLEHSIESINKFYGTSYGNYTEMEDDAGIIHFSAFKPWRNRLMPYTPIWQKYYNLSPYGDTNLEHEPEYPKILHVTEGNISLFGCIPFISIKENELRKVCSLFGFLRLYKLKKRNNIRKFYLFGFLPIYSYSWITRDVK